MLYRKILGDIEQDREKERRGGLYNKCLEGDANLVETFNFYLRISNIYTMYFDCIPPHFPPNSSWLILLHPSFNLTSSLLFLFYNPLSQISSACMHTIIRSSTGVEAHPWTTLTLPFPAAPHLGVGSQEHPPQSLLEFWLVWACAGNHHCCLFMGSIVRSAEDPVPQDSPWPLALTILLSIFCFVPWALWKNDMVYMSHLGLITLPFSSCSRQQLSYRNKLI